LGSVQYRVQSVNELLLIINHFDKYPLITQKRADYELFKRVLELIQDKEHLTMEGFNKIVAIKSSMNLFLSEELKVAFPEIVPVERYLISSIDQEVKDPNWLAGFTEAEGCFYINLHKSAGREVNERVKIGFKLSQHVRDEQLMRSLITYFGCGNINRDKNSFNFIVTKFSDIRDKIIPFFEKYPIIGNKLLDYQDFCKVAKLMENKSHLTEEGLNKIRKIKAGMNIGRK